jgi:hypothetical protein
VKKTVDGATETFSATSVANVQPQPAEVLVTPPEPLDAKTQVRYESAAQRILCRAVRAPDVRHFLFKDKTFRSHELSQVSVTWRKGRTGKTLSFVVDGAHPISVKL